MYKLTIINFSILATYKILVFLLYVGGGATVAQQPDSTALRHAEEAQALFSLFQAMPPCESPELRTWKALAQVTYTDIFDTASMSYLPCPNFSYLSKNNENYFITEKCYLCIEKNDSCNILFITQELFDWGNVWDYGLMLEITPSPMFDPGILTQRRIFSRIPCRVQGYLKLNSTGADHWYFQLTDAVVLPPE